MVTPSDIIHLSSKAFWDVDMSKLDYEKNADYIIRKVFEYGSWEDLLEVTAYYQIDKIKKALLTAHYLTEKTMVFSSKLFHIPLPEYKCYNTKQYHPIS